MLFAFCGMHNLYLSPIMQAMHTERHYRILIAEEEMYESKDGCKNMHHIYYVSKLTQFFSTNTIMHPHHVETLYRKV